MKTHIGLRVPADITYAHTVRTCVKEALRHTKVPHAWMYRLILVADELFMNAVDHGSESKECAVTIDVSYDAEVVQIQISDEGKGAHGYGAQHIREHLKDTPRIHDTSGRGLATITKSWTDGVDVMMSPQGGTTVAVYKFLHNCDADEEVLYLKKSKKNKEMHVEVDRIEDLFEGDTTEKLKELMKNIETNEGCTYVFDFAHVSSLDSRCVGRFTELYLLVKERKGKVAFKHVSPQIRPLFDKIQIYDIIMS